MVQRAGVAVSPCFIACRRESRFCVGNFKAAYLLQATIKSIVTHERTTHMDLGLLSARIVLGLLMAGHGAQKLFGWFGGYGLAGTSGFFENLGFKPGRL